MNKKTLVITSSGLVAITLVLLFATSNGVFGQNSLTNNDGGALPPDMPMTKVIAGKPVSDVGTASSIVGYTVNSPGNLPSDYKVQTINADEKYKITTLLVSPQTVTTQTTHNGFFMQQKGILIFISPNRPGFDESKWMSSWISDNSAKVININGNQGAVHDIVTGKGFDGETVQAPAELVFVKNNAIYEIRGMVSMDQLINIANTL